MSSTDPQIRKRGAGRVSASLLLVVLAALLACAPGANAMEDDDPPRSEKPYASLDDAVAAEAVDPRVVTDLDRRGSVEALVNLDAAALIEEAEAAAPDGDDRSRAILGHLRPALAALKDEALASLDHKLEVVRDYETLPTMVVRFESAEALLELINRPQVGGVAANRAMEASTAQSLLQIRQPQTAALGARGANTAVAILDTGLDFTRAAFGSCTSPGTPAGCRVAFAQDFGFPDGTLDQAAEGFHGTNVAGIAIGVAPDARILALDVFEGAGAFHDDILAAVDFVNRTQPGFRTRAMNMSFGVKAEHWTSPCSNPWTNQYLFAFRLARSLGITPVVSSGNFAVVNGSFVNGVTYPACTPGAVSVGAVYDANVGTRITDDNQNGVVDTFDCVDLTTAADRITCYSQSGPTVSVLAPGDAITAAGITMLGTSQAAPHVTGAVAVLAGARPQASVDAIEFAITQTGRPIMDTRNGITKRRLDLRDAFSVVSCFSPGLFPIIGTPGPDTLTGSFFNDVIIGLGGDDTINGGAGNDVLCGSDGNDTIVGGPGVDIMQGDEEADVLDGGDNADLMAGNAGDDRLLAGPPSSTLDELVGGPGTDTADYGLRTVPLTIALDDLGGDGAAAEDDNVHSDIEVVQGGTGDDRLFGSAGGNILRGGEGADRLDGGLGPDRLEGGAGTDRASYIGVTAALTVTLDGQPNDGAFGENDNVLTENVFGGAGDDVIVGDADANRLDGGPGDDRLRDGETSCSGFCVANSADVLVGGSGRDRADYSVRFDSVDISLDGVANDGAWGEGDNVLTEDITGGSAEDWLSGDAASNSISGGPGDDWLTGGAGPDSLLCGLGIDFAVDLEAQDTQSDCEYVGLPQG